MRLKKLAIAAIGILIVGAWLLLGPRLWNSPSTTEYSSTDKTNEVGGESTPATEVPSGVTSSTNPELTNMPSVSQAPNDLQGTTTATGPSPDDLSDTGPSPAISTSDLTEGLIGDLPTPPGRLAPDVWSDPLQFSNIRIYRNDDLGVFAGQANVKNLGATFLNQLVLAWKILDSGGEVLDQGQLSWPTLAPNETITITFVGKAPFSEIWSRIEFTLVR